jgi:RNA polymerase sigma-70 factor (ECF subfamily)
MLLPKKIYTMRQYGTLKFLGEFLGTMTTASNNRVLTKAHHDFSCGLSRFANLKTNNKALSDDLVQETFIKTWSYLQSKGKIDLMRAFLYHVLDRLIIDEYRKKKVMSLDLLTENGFEPRAVDAKNISNLIDGKALTSLIKKLPLKYRGAITMRYTKDLSLKEMSAITHQSQNTMSVQVHRGLIKLRTLYEGSFA